MKKRLKVMTKICRSEIGYWQCQTTTFTWIKDETFFLIHHLRHVEALYILESNLHPNLIRTFPSTAPCPQGDWLNNIGCYRCVKIRCYACGRWVILVLWSGSFSRSVRNLIWARIMIQLWVMTANLMNNKL